MSKNIFYVMIGDHDDPDNLYLFRSSFPIDEEITLQNDFEDFLEVLQDEFEVCLDCEGGEYDDYFEDGLDMADADPDDLELYIQKATEICERIRDEYYPDAKITNHRV